MYFFFSIADLAWEAKANGVLIGTLLLVLVVVQLVRIALQVARKAAAACALDPLWQPREALRKRARPGADHRRCSSPRCNGSA